MSTTFEILKKNIHAYHSTYTKGEMQKIADEIDEANRAGGIASYYTSPLACQIRYESETGNKPTDEYRYGHGGGFIHYTNAYVQWLESKLIREAGE